MINTPGKKWTRDGQANISGGSDKAEIQQSNKNIRLWLKWLSADKVLKTVLSY